MKKVILGASIILLVVVLVNLHFDSGTNNFSSNSNLYASVNDVSGVLWTDVESSSIVQVGDRVIVPDYYRTVSLNMSELRNILNQAPLESIVKAKNSSVILSLPLPDGSFGRFKIVESPVMAPELAAQFPEIKTYCGQGIDDGTANVRLDLTPQGFHASVLSVNGRFFIDPYSKNDVTNYISYYSKDLSVDPNEFVCQVENTPDNSKNNNLLLDNPSSIGDQLRTYRLALACTGEYAAYHGGTVPTALAAMTTSINRVNQVYENDLSVRMVLVANNSLLVYTNSSTDPYTNNNGSTMLSQNQSNIDAVIGSANYDIGHVFSTGGGGIAGLGVVCVSGQKARGVTGLPAPVGDPFDIDYVAHEMGHQFAGNHTQNNTNCNANPSTAFEPGSASTIMGYAGVCAPNLQNHSDPYFHVGSLIEIDGFTTGFGGTCPVNTATGNNAPTVTLPSSGFTIPIGTPFMLTGSATDPDSDPLTYCWEEYDVGPQGNPNSPSGTAPIFRSFNPTTSPSRMFPKKSDILNNTTTLGERLPTYTRLLKFRLTARDNRAGGGGHGYDLMFFTADASAGPFLVTSPNTAVVWEEGHSEMVTWDVANTNNAPVSCANVNILLSTDGGDTFPITLASNTPNDGSESITVPNNLTATARVKVESVGNIFFDLSNANFTIQMASSISNLNSGVPERFGLAQNYPNPFNPETKINFDIPSKSAVTLKIYDIRGVLINTLVNSEVLSPGFYSASFNAASLPSGVYYYRLEAGSFVETKKMLLIK
ncbi:MAG: T9SS type A sorting domain-containing protein [Ignavibacteriae bacterium]|nr:T9SS type A sorting domain-containing protein [Ignavibacteriota bacterium]MCB9244104.1 T9SS type A sorting domain-containing protein [Ignavibacteriales bacterium]